MHTIYVKKKKREKRKKEWECGQRGKGTNREPETAFIYGNMT